MSNGRKVTVAFTQAEARALINFRAIGYADSHAVDRAIEKLQHQLNAVRGVKA